MARLQIFDCYGLGTHGSIYFCDECGVEPPIFVLDRAIVGPNNKVIFVTVVDIAYELDEGTCDILASLPRILSTQSLLQNIASFNPGILGSIITFCMSVDTTTSFSSSVPSLSFVYSSQHLFAVSICILKSLQVS